MEEKVFTRKELYDTLWAEPATVLLKKYDITQSALKKLCQDMNIPLPENGHWQKIKFGKAVSAHPLPSEYSGEHEVSLMLKVEGDQNNLTFLSPRSILQKNIEVDQELFLNVPDKLTNPDKLIIAARESLKEREKWLDNGLVNTRSEGLSIKVAPDNVSRALRFMDTLIKNLRKRGYFFSSENNQAKLVIEGEKIAIALREKLDRVPVKGNYSWEQYDYRPSGIFIFSIVISYRNFEWKDGKVSHEKQLSKIIAGLELKAKEWKEENNRIKAFWAERKKEDQIRQEIEQKKQKELSDFKDLLKESEQWNQAKVLREYIDAIEAKANENSTMSEERKNWLSWVRKKIDLFDPIIKREDEALKNIEI